MRAGDTSGWDQGGSQDTAQPLLFAEEAPGPLILSLSTVGMPCSKQEGPAGYKKQAEMKNDSPHILISSEKSCVHA